MDELLFEIPTGEVEASRRKSGISWKKRSLRIRGRGSEGRPIGGNDRGGGPLMAFEDLHRPLGLSGFAEPRLDYSDQRRDADPAARSCDTLVTRRPDAGHGLGSLLVVAADHLLVPARRALSLALNMFMPLMFGRELETAGAPLQFLKYFFITGLGRLCACCAFAAFDRATIGSPARSLVCCGLCDVFPHATMYLYFVIRSKPGRRRRSLLYRIFCRSAGRGERHFTLLAAFFWAGC